MLNSEAERGEDIFTVDGGLILENREGLNEKIPCP